MSKPMTQAEMQARIAELESQLKAKVRFTVSKQGGISIMGLQRFPVTLYWNQWEQILERAQDLRDFADKNKATLSQGKA